MDQVALRFVNFVLAVLVCCFSSTANAFQPGHHRPRGCAGRATTTSTSSQQEDLSLSSYSQQLPSSLSSSTSTTTRLYAAAKKKSAAAAADVETYRKKDLVDIVASETELTKTEVDLVVSTFLDSIVEVCNDYRPSVFLPTCCCCCC